LKKRALAETAAEDDPDAVGVSPEIEGYEGRGFGPYNPRVIREY